MLSVILLSSVGIAHAQEIPDWVEDTLILWISGDVTDDEFIRAMFFVFNQRGLLDGIFDQGIGNEEPIDDIMDIDPIIPGDDPLGEPVLEEPPDVMTDPSMDDVDDIQVMDDADNSMEDDMNDNSMEDNSMNDNSMNDNNIKDVKMDMSEFKCMGDGQCITGTITGYNEAFAPKINSYLTRMSIATAPELRDEGGQTAVDYVESICPVGSTAMIDEDDGQIGNLDGRIIGVIYCNGVNLNEVLGTSEYGSMWTKFCKQSEFVREPWAWDNGCSTVID